MYMYYEVLFYSLCSGIWMSDEAVTRSCHTKFGRERVTTDFGETASCTDCKLSLEMCLKQNLRVNCDYLCSGVTCSGRAVSTSVGHSMKVHNEVRAAWRLWRRPARGALTSSRASGKIWSLLVSAQSGFNTKNHSSATRRKTSAVCNFLGIATATSSKVISRAACGKVTECTLNVSARTPTSKSGARRACTAASGVKINDLALVSSSTTWQVNCWVANTCTRISYASQHLPFVLGTRYIGQWLNDQRNGKGIYFDAKSNVYFEGSFQNDQTSVSFYYWSQEITSTEWIGVCTSGFWSFDRLEKTAVQSGVYSRLGVQRKGKATQSCTCTCTCTLHV